jgi:hypothetical protein
MAQKIAALDKRLEEIERFLSWNQHAAAPPAPVGQQGPPAC